MFNQKIVEDFIRKITNSYQVVNEMESEEEINLYVQFYDLSRFKKESNIEGRIVKGHVKD